MIGFLASRFIKDYQNTSDAAVRRAYGVLCGAVGIAINLLLFALKLFAGTLAGSVAITADAFNNLSDAGATVPLLGFGYSLAKGAEKAVQEQGWLGVMTGGLSATAGGIAAAVVFAVLMALIFKPGDKR